MPATAQRPLPGREEDIAYAEAQLGVRLPTWWRDRLAVANGGTIDDSRGATRRRWSILPVLDRRDRKSMLRTAENLVHVTRGFDDVGRDRRGVVVAWADGFATVLMIVTAPAEGGEEPRLMMTSARPSEMLEIDPSRLGTAIAPRDPEQRRSRSEIPAFRYHPDPVSTGSIVELPAAVCPVCERSTGWAYAATPYAIGTHRDICPWCIADGSAGRTLAARFVDVHWFDDDPPAPLDRLDELAMRTPGFVSWQQEVWQYCCRDACAFHGIATADTVSGLPRVDLEELGIDDSYIDALRDLEADGHVPTDAIPFEFRCLHCGRHHVWIDVS